MTSDLATALAVLGLFAAFWAGVFAAGGHRPDNDQHDTTHRKDHE